MKKWIVGVMVWLVAIPAYAAPSQLINTPNSFTPNTTIQSSQVNADFNEVQTQYNSHTHTDITSVGAITSGSWLGSPVGTGYGGTGQDFSATAIGSLIYFNPAGTMTTLSPGTAGQGLITNGVGAAPSWSTVGGANDAITRGLELNYQNSTCVIASAGVVYFGSTIINSATSNTLLLGTATHWASGSVVNYGAAGWNYVGVDNVGLIKLLGNGYPNSCDTLGNTQGTKYYYYDNIAAKYWRVIGAFRQNAGAITNGWYQDGNKIMLDVPVTVANAVAAAWTQAGCDAAIPPISRCGLFGIQVDRAGGASYSLIRRSGSTWNTTSADGVGLAAASNGGYSTGQRMCITDDRQNIDHLESAADTVLINVEGFILNIR